MSIPVFAIGQIALNLFKHDDPKNLPSRVACLREAPPCGAKAGEENLKQGGLL